MPGQIFDDGGQAASWADGSGVVSSIDLVPITPPPETVPSQVMSILGQDQGSSILPGAIMWGAPVNAVLLDLIPISIDATKPFNGDLMNNSVFDLWNYNVDVKVIKVDLLFLSVDGSRTWNGFGGFQYIPSFPQLNRQETSWPHAT